MNSSARRTRHADTWAKGAAPQPYNNQKFNLRSFRLITSEVKWNTSRERSTGFKPMPRFVP